MNYALILAGGSGQRMGQDIPKQFIHIYDKPIIIYTLEKFQNNPNIDYITVACAAGWESFVSAYAKQFNITKLRAIVPAGETRHLTISGGIFAHIGVATDDDVILITDANRPMVPDEVIDDNIEKCLKYGVALSVLKSYDSLYRFDGSEFCGEDIDRSTVLRGQVPESAKFSIALDIYTKAKQDNITDSSAISLAKRYGKKVALSIGSEISFKLTTIEDMDMFKALITTTRSPHLK